MNTTLPNIHLRWTAVEVVGVFLRYNVQRRAAGESSYTRIAIIEDVSQTHYHDYTVIAGVTYEYVITQTQTIGATTLESALPTPVQSRVDFRWAYVHAVGDPTQFVPLYSFSIDETVDQDATFRQAWGRRAGTAFFGDRDASEIRFDQLPDVQRGEIWEALRHLLSMQPDSAAIFCLRIGVSQQRFFCNLTQGRRRGDQGTYSPSVQVTEVEYEEAV